MDPASFVETHAAPAAVELLKDFGRGGRNVVDVADEKGRAFVGIVVDAGSTRDTSALFDALAWRPDVADEVVSRSLRMALDIAGRLPHLSVSCVAPFTPQLLAAHGFVEAYRMTLMQRTAAPFELVPPLPGQAFVDADASHAAAYLDVARRAFAQVDGSFMPDFEIFQARIARASPPARLLVEGERVVGFVRVGAGELASLGRDPDAQGRGLGRIVVAEGLRMLGAAERTVGLEVAASNDVARRLYRALGFVDAGETTTWRRSVA